MICGGVGVRLPQTMSASKATPATSQRRCTASAVWGSVTLGAVTGIADHIGTRRWHEAETLVADLGITLYVVETDARGVTEVVLEVHLSHVLALETKPH